MLALQFVRSHVCRAVSIGRFHANENGQPSPSREDLRLALMLTWWEEELQRCLRGKGSKSELREAQHRVLDLRSRIPADTLPAARVWAIERARKCGAGSNAPIK